VSVDECRDTPAQYSLRVGVNNKIERSILFDFAKYKSSKLFVL
jgi:hypothetical protein